MYLLFVLFRVAPHLPHLFVLPRLVVFVRSVCIVHPVRLAVLFGLNMNNISLVACDVRFSATPVMDYETSHDPFFIL